VTSRIATVITLPVTAAPPARPARRTRLIGIDATRGVALLGMMTIHSLPESTAAGHPTWTFTVFAGRAAAAFAVLAGIGIAFMTGRRRVSPAGGRATVASLLTRALVIGAIGIVLGYTDAELAVVILPYYAVMFVLVIPLVFLPTWTVATLAAAMALGMPALSHVVQPHLPTPVLDNPTLGYLFDHPLQVLAELTITGEYPALTWLAYLSAGLVIGRLSLGRARVAVGLLVTGVTLAVAAAVASSVLLHHYGGLARILAAPPDPDPLAASATDLLSFGGDGTVPSSTWWWLAVDAPHTGTPPELIGSIGTAAALLGLFLLADLVTRPRLRRLIASVRAPLAAAGGMTLTFYTLHIMFINSEYDTYPPTKGYLLQVATIVLIGLVWRATAGRGPLEGFAAFLAARAARWAGAARRRAGARSMPPPEPPLTDGKARQARALMS
jgi:hypothetical protein